MDKMEQKSLILNMIECAEQLVQPLALLQIDLVNWEIKNGETPPPLQLRQEEEEHENYLSSQLNELHIAIIAYLSLLEKDSLLRQFYSKFGEDFDAISAARAMAYIHETGEHANNHLIEIKSFLRGLNFYGSGTLTQNELQIAILERVLRSTVQVCAATKTVIKKEKCIQDALKNYLQITFPTTIGSSVAHPKINKKYFCDIYIEELGIGIEVKLSRTKANLDSALAEISDDVVGYGKHPHYTKFYALFYVTEDILGLERFTATWKSRNYPSNWTPIYVIGKPVSA
ncbi:hypothetical protein [Pseudomonas sp. MB-090624]|uniref:PD-(D/E)XK nuclease domain-containing protein n=1 Tax=Pseudomonas sp. MB-090624 TaxID=2213078 RepID=UPI000D9E9B95|nr:hypothetical protein [Pseudomonas sp. MB-090624]PYC04923.1 hypothetical protein DMX12_08605 [Pseudomonas sp. MB-090624]